MSVNGFITVFLVVLVATLIAVLFWAAVDFVVEAYQENKRQKEYEEFEAYSFSEGKWEKDRVEGLLNHNRPVTLDEAGGIYLEDTETLDELCDEICERPQTTYIHEFVRKDGTTIHFDQGIIGQDVLIYDELDGEQKLFKFQDLILDLELGVVYNFWQEV